MGVTEMATNDFWRRVGGLPSDPPLESDAQERIGTELFGAILMDLAVGSGGYSTAEARVSMQLVPGSSADNEFIDFVSSAMTVTNANANTRKFLRMLLAIAVRAVCSISEQGNAFPASLYDTPEKVRLRVKEIIVSLGGVPQGSLAL